MTSGIFASRNSASSAWLISAPRRAVVAHERGLLDRAGELGEHRAQRVVALVSEDGAGGLLLREQDLVDLLAGTDAGDDHLDVAVADEVGGEVGHLGARALRDVGLARLAERTAAKIVSTASSSVSRKRVISGVVMVTGPPAGDLVEEERHDRAARGEHVAVASADEARLGGADVALDVDALLDRLGHAHDVDGLARLVGRDAHDRLDGQVVLRDGAHEVLGALDVGAHGLPREVLAARHLLERRGGEDDVFVSRDAKDARVVAHVADDELQALPAVLEDDLVGRGAVVHEVEAHVVLLGLVAREDGDALGHALGAGHEPPNEHLAERAGAAGDEDALAFEQSWHEVSLRIGV